MKRVFQIIVFLTACLAFAILLPGCTSGSTPSQAQTPPEQAQPAQEPDSAAPKAAETAAPSAEPSEEPAPSPTPEPTPEPAVDVPSTTSDPDYRLPSNMLPSPDPKPGVIIIQESPPAATQSVDVTPLATEIFERTNQERVRHGLKELTYGYELQNAADVRAYECSVKFSHTRPDGRSCHSVVEELDYYVTGENLILADKQIASAEVMLAEWMASEGHRANILLPDFTELAVGVCEKDGVVYVAQIFLG